jgi:Leucine-rich repeat (LRR) protein
MKPRLKLFVILLAVTLLIRCIKDDSNTLVQISDHSFLDVLIQNGYDTDRDGKISFAEAKAVISLNIDGRNISDLSGIESFSNLEKLDCGNNTFTELNLSSNHALKILLIGGAGKLTKLNVSGDTSLTVLDCDGNHLTTLDVSKNTLLDSLVCSNNQLEILSFKNNLALRTVECSSNNISSIDVSKNTALTFLDCYYNKLSTLDISNNIALTHLECSQNLIGNLDVSKNKSLKYLSCGSNGNFLNSLDVTKNIALEYLACSYNHLTSLDVTKNSVLSTLYCGNNVLTVLNISENTSLNTLFINDMPSLNKVCVWGLPFPPVSFTLDTTNSLNVYFSTDCSN